MIKIGVNKVRYISAICGIITVIPLPFRFPRNDMFIAKPDFLAVIQQSFIEADRLTGVKPGDIPSPYWVIKSTHAALNTALRGSTYNQDEFGLRYFHVPLFNGNERKQRRYAQVFIMASGLNRLELVPIKGTEHRGNLAAARRAIRRGLRKR